MAVIRKSQETPLHPPYARGDKGLRQANQKPHVEYWHEVLAHVDSVYAKKFGQHYPWNNLARKNLWNLARVHSAWGVMALWDLYLETESHWARRTGWSVYGMIRDAGRLTDDPRFKQLAFKHEESLARHRSGQFSTTKDILDRVGFDGKLDLEKEHTQLYDLQVRRVAGAQIYRRASGAETGAVFEDAIVFEPIAKPSARRA